MKKIIGYICYTNPFEDRRTWSGLIYKVREAIENAGYEVRWIQYKRTNTLIKIAKMPYTFLSKISHKMILRERTAFVGYLQSKTIKKNSYFNECDYFFFCDQSPVLAYFKTEKPNIYYSDAIFDKMINFYWFNMHNIGIKEGRRIDIMAMNNANIILHSSDWASISANEIYKIDKQKLHVLEFGANLDDNLINKVLTHKKEKVTDSINILFSGIDWERKGGDIAIDTVKKINFYGIKAVLHIVGIREIPSQYSNESCIVQHGFLNKNISSEYNEYVNTIALCDLMLLPTKAECSATVYCEAAAFGLPVFTYDTGGVSNYVINDVNGYCLSISKKSEDFCNIIMENIHKNKLPRLSTNGKELYKNKLSWNAWSKRFSEIINTYENI